MKLLHEIARCPNVRYCLENPSSEHPCAKIVMSQSSKALADHQVPEPWSGHIGEAPLLFLSSNPSISDTEDFPRWSWSDEQVENFFENRFGGGHKVWTKDGRYGLQLDGTYDRAVNFWSSVRQRAIELYERDVQPGIDYALTEVVHCKSRSEIGVKEALKECANLYLRRVVEISEAKVIIALGDRAKDTVVQEFGIPESASVHGPMNIGGRERLITFLPHPNAWSVRTFAKLLPATDLQKLRSFLKTSPC